MQYFWKPYEAHESANYHLFMYYTHVGKLLIKPVRKHSDGYAGSISEIHCRCLQQH